MYYLKSVDTAKSDYFCDFYAFFENEGLWTSIYFYDKGYQLEIRLVIYALEYKKFDLRVLQPSERHDLE